MAVFSPGTDKLVTFLVRFFCGVLIGTGVWLFLKWKYILGDLAHDQTSGLFWSWLLWSGIIGLGFGLTSGRDKRQWLE